nr:MAG TPA: hypothetical protein [Caudoviricetes sp.]
MSRGSGLVIFLFLEKRYIPPLVFFKNFLYY